MRARNIKPSIFKNEILGTADPLLTILFEGLWCEADRDGRLEDRPLRLKAEILPYRDNVDVDAMLAWLGNAGFIARFEANSVKVIQVLKFSEHQRPHNNEVASVLPSMDAIKHNQGKKPAQPRRKALRSDSGSLIPDSLILIPDCLNGTARRTAPPIDDRFVDFKLAYPERAGAQGWRKAERAARARISEGHSWGEILAGASRYAEYVRATDALGTEFVKQAATFLGPDLFFLEPWAQPPSKADVRLNGNISAAEEFMRRTETAA